MVLTNNVDLDWSLRPLSVWLRLITGIDLLRPNVSRSKKARFHQIIFISINLICQLFVIRQLGSDLASITPSIYNNTRRHPVSVTRKWNTGIDYINWMLADLMGHVVMLIIVSARWPIVMRSFRILTSLSIDQQHLFRKLRRFSLIGIFYVVFFVSIE